MTQVCHKKRSAICFRSSCKWLLQVRPFATVVYFTFLAFQCCQMLSKKQPWQWPLTFKKQHCVSTNWPNIATKFARRGTQRSLLLSNWSSWHPAASATQWTEFESNDESSTSPGESCARLPAGLRPHRHWCLRWSTWSAQRGLWGQKDGNLLPLPLQLTLVSPTICNCLFHMFGLSMLPNVVKETAVTMALNIQKKTRRLNELAKHRNQVCNTRHPEKFASFKLVQLAPRSFCHAEDGIISHLWRFRDNRLQFFRCSRTSPAAWLGSPLLSLKTSTNWWKATSENCTRPLQSMSFTKFFLSLASMLIEVWPSAAIAALGTWHARSRSSCSSC